ncbi:MAG: SGNH/GDSL hydrolase family protein [Candidatus Atribacteria bacterium]|nr:SGNH/GDSL hydrolase family protein [Candidatus Atribacteria bacterium]
MFTDDSKVVLCFGDSLTWGWDPVTRGRFSFSKRWTGVLQRELGEGYRIIEEGLNGRTTMWDDPIEGEKNGKEYLVPCLESQMPIDLVIIMLGTNDMKERFALSAFDIAASADALAQIVQRSRAGRNGESPKVLLVAPPPVGKLTDWAEMMEGAMEKSLKIGRYYEINARNHGFHFLDAGKIVKSSDLDGLHWEAEENLKFGKTVATKVREIV